METNEWGMNSGVEELTTPWHFNLYGSDRTYIRYMDDRMTQYGVQAVRDAQAQAQYEIEDALGVTLVASSAHGQVVVTYGKTARHTLEDPATWSSYDIYSMIDEVLEGAE